MTDTSEIFEHLKKARASGDKSGSIKSADAAIAGVLDELQRIYDEVTVLTSENGSPYEIEHRQERARNKLRQAELLLSILPLVTDS